MVVTESVLEDIFTGFNTRFNDMYKSLEPQYPKIAMTVESDGDKETYAWVDQFPGLREWIGSRQYNDMVQKGQTVTNILYENTVWLKRTDVEDDKLTLYGNKVEQLSRNLVGKRDKLQFDLLNNGFTGTCYDDLTFFATNHQWRGETISNKGTKALSDDNFDEAYKILLTTIGTGGANDEAPLDYNPEFMLVVGPALRSIAKGIVGAERNDFGATNTNFKAADLLVSNLITGNKWFLVVTNNPLMPLVYQSRIDVEITALTDPQNALVFDRDAYAWGLRSRFASAYGLWQLAWGSTGA